MLACDHECIQLLADECVAGAVVDSVADRVCLGVDARVANFVTRAVFEVDDREEIFRIGFAVLGFGEMQRAPAGGAGGRGRCSSGG